MKLNLNSGGDRHWHGNRKWVTLRRWGDVHARAESCARDGEEGDFGRVASLSFSFNQCAARAHDSLPAWTSPQRLKVTH